MAKAVQPAVATDEILFELKRFELVDGRLELGGRWFGVRGRRFVRPTLTPLRGRDLSRVLADLEHKPWAAGDGEAWEAAFPWKRNGAGVRFELSVSPDIVIQLPSPSAKLTLPRRIAAEPRRPSIMAAWRPPEVESVEESPSPPPEPEPRPEASPVDVTALVAQLEAAKGEAEAGRGELGTTRAELESTRAELDGARAELERTTTALQAATGRLSELEAQLEQAEAAAAAAAAQDAASSEELRAALDEATRGREQLSADLAAREQAISELRAELSRSTAAAQEAARERDEAIAAHGAALVMRRATRAAPYGAHSSGWWRTALAVIALLAIVFAILIVLHVL